MGSVEEKKIGSINLTKPQKLAIAKIVRSPEWAAIENWFRQRQTNLAVSGISLAQNELDLHKYKGRISESRDTVLSLRQIVTDLQAEEDKNTNNS